MQQSPHWQLIVAADFFTVEVWTRRGLQRFGSAAAIPFMQLGRDLN
jgi:hypothetical protein